MRIRTIAPLAVMFVGLTVLGCQKAEEGSMDEATTEQPAAEQMNDGAMDNGAAATDSTMADTTDTGAMEEEGGATEE